MHAGQAALDAVMVKTELFMIEAEQVEHCRVKVVPAHPVHGTIADRRWRHRPSGTDSTAGHPHGEPGVIMIAPVPERVAGLWVNGVRPNSVVNVTSVSSSTRCFKSFSNAATG